MSLRLIPPTPLWRLLPTILPHARPALNLPILWRIPRVLSVSLTHSLAFLALSLNLLPTLDDIWESVLRAVPKKKTTHSKKRHRQLAGKALKDVTELNKCSSCGRVKRAHLLCPYCVKFVRDMLGGKLEEVRERMKEEKEKEKE